MIKYRKHKKSYTLPMLCVLCLDVSLLIIMAISIKFNFNLHLSGAKKGIKAHSRSFKASLGLNGSLSQPNGEKKLI